MNPWLTPGESLRLHEERLQQRIADGAPFRFHLPIGRLARAVVAGTGDAIGRVRRAPVGAEGPLRGGRASTAA
jgi:hypothetical protein